MYCTHLSYPEGGFDNIRYRSLDLVLAAEIAGRKRLETTRRYSLATRVGRGKRPWKACGY
jgi:hypothetical protein